MEPWNGDRLASWIYFEPSRPHPKISSQTGIEPIHLKPKSEIRGVSVSYKRRQRSTEENMHVENFLVKLIRAKKWQEVIQRCLSHPEEAQPTIIDERGNRFQKHATKRVANEMSLDEGNGLIYQETPLGLACASTEIDSAELREVVLALLSANPSQVRASQLIPGHTPLRDALLNPYCNSDILRALLGADEKCHCESQTGKSAAHMRDRNGLFPIDHLIMGCQLGSHIYANDMLRVFVTKRPSDGNLTKDFASPLVRLLTMGTSFGIKTSNSPQSPSSVDHARLSRIHEATRLLLKDAPDLLYHCSFVTGCSPLHIALRNYGNYLPLIDELFRPDTSRILAKVRNNYGDLPIHVACSVGVPLDVLRKVISQTMAGNESDTCMPLNQLVWSTNNSGYTPVDLEWIRHIESGKGFHASRSFYPLEPTDMRKRCFKEDQYYQDLLKEAVGHITEDRSSLQDAGEEMLQQKEAMHVFGTLLERISLFVLDPLRSTSTKRTGHTLLHRLCCLSAQGGPNFPLPVKELYIWLYRRHITTKDCNGRLPLHCVLETINMRHSEPGSLAGHDDWSTVVLKLLNEKASSVKENDGKGRLPLHILLAAPTNPSWAPMGSKSRQRVVKELVRLFPESVDHRDPVTNLYPFQLAALDPTLVDSIYFLLRQSPSRCCCDNGS